MQTVGLVVPCRNEERRLRPKAFFDALNALPGLSFVFVDDGSTDATADILERMAYQSPNVDWLQLARNQGKAEAVRQGMRTLLEKRVDVVGFWDADLAAPLEEVPAMLRELDEREGCVAVLGVRWAHLGASIDRSTGRGIAGKVMRSLIRLVSGYPFVDTQCGAKIFRRSLAENLFKRRFISRWLFDVELLLRIPRGDLWRVSELPLRFWHDVPGSKLTWRDTFRILPDLLKIAIHRRSVL